MSSKCSDSFASSTDPSTVSTDQVPTAGLSIEVSNRYMTSTNTVLNRESIRWLTDFQQVSNWNLSGIQQDIPGDFKPGESAQSRNGSAKTTDENSMNRS